MELAFLCTFQFPSTGKAYLNCVGKCVIGCASRAFQFPSTGKAYLNQRSCSVETTENLVSIPFNRESISELAKKTPPLSALKGVLFQFPSNGKAYLNESLHIFR